MIPVTISLEVPSSLQVGDAIELSANCSVPWPVSYSVEGPAILNGRMLTAVDTGKVIVSATQLSEDASRNLLTVREEIVVKADIVAGIGDPSGGVGKIYAFPNPAQNRLQIRADAPNWREALVIVQNALGQQVDQTQLQAYQTEIDMAAYTPGLYLIILRNGSDQQVLRINKQ